MGAGLPACSEEERVSLSCSVPQPDLDPCSSFSSPSSSQPRSYVSTATRPHLRVSQGSGQDVPGGSPPGPSLGPRLEVKAGPATAEDRTTQAARQSPNMARLQTKAKPSSSPSPAHGLQRLPCMRRNLRLTLTSRRQPLAKPFFALRTKGLLHLH